MKISARERKLILIAAAIVAILALFYALMIQQEPDRAGIAETVELKKRMLLRQRETMFLEGVYESRLQLYTRRLRENMERLLPGDNPNVAGAELLNTLTDFADISGVEITNKNILNEEAVGNLLLKISARIVTRCSMEQLVHFLTEIENYDRFLTIDEFMIRSSRNRRDLEMRPNLTISGYIRSNESETESGSRDTIL